VPSSWGLYSGTVWDWATFVGTLGLFFALLFLFLRFLPAISIFEMRQLLPESKVLEGNEPTPGAPAHAMAGAMTSAREEGT
jgi:molybdopterin-containing oxidoreductase family membrane subunit